MQGYIYIRLMCLIIVLLLFFKENWLDNGGSAWQSGGGCRLRPHTDLGQFGNQQLLHL